MTTERLGLRPFVLVFLGFALTFNPWWVRYLPRYGWRALVISPQTYFLLASLILMYAAKLGPRDIGFSAKSLQRHLALGVGLGLLPIGFTLIIVMALNAAQFESTPVFLGLSVPTYVLLFIYAPISEEIFFRGLFCRALSNFYPAHISIAASATIFSLAHGGLKVGPLALGVISGLLILKYKNLASPIVFHAVTNSYGVLAAKYYPNLFISLKFFFQ